jgi:hypothetical protein
MPQCTPTQNDNKEKEEKILPEKRKTINKIPVTVPHTQLLRRQSWTEPQFEVKLGVVATCKAIGRRTTISGQPSKNHEILCEKYLQQKWLWGMVEVAKKKKLIKSLSIWSGYKKIKEKGHKVLMTEMKKGCHYIFCEQ